MNDLIIRGGMVVTPDSTRQADVAVENGQIVEVAETIHDSSKTEINAEGLHVFPGLIDVHVHFNEPGRAQWEGITTGSAALAAGGGTLYADMPLNSSPPVLDKQTFLAKKEVAEKLSHTDFALWGGLTPDNLKHLEELAQLGVIGFKAFMSNSGIEEFRAVDDLSLYEGMKIAAGLGLPVAVHAESDAMTSGLTKQIREQGRKGVRDYLQSRPIIAELEAISRAILFAEDTACDLHVVHVSSARGVRLITEAKKRGVRVSCETCPHYLHFSGEDLERLSASAKCAPPLRNDKERQELWQALGRGEIDFVASDHSPSSPDLKERNDFFEVWGGISGIQSTLQVLLSQQGLSLEHIAVLTAKHPGERFSLKNKGEIKVGYDADLTLVDLSKTQTLSKNDLFYRHKQSPYLGQTLRGVIKQTLVRGGSVFQNGNIIAQSFGQFVQPSPNLVDYSS